MVTKSNPNQASLCHNLNQSQLLESTIAIFVVVARYKVMVHEHVWLVVFLKPPPAED